MSTKQIKGNLHSVKLADLQLACEANTSWWNPRRTPLPDGTVCRQGLDEQNISELSESIRRQGLNDPIQVRQLEDGTLHVIAGERRCNAIRSLIDADSECYDAEDSAWKTAEEVYEYVEARLHQNISDEEAWEIAFQENSTSIDIGDNATIALIKRWRELGWDDSAILKMTGKSITWLRETDHIIDLDHDTFSAFAAGELNRSAAVDLSKIEDVTERLQRLERAKEYAQKHLDALRQRAKKELDRAEMTAEFAEASVVEAEMTGGDAHSASQEAESSLQNLHDKQEKSDQLESRSAEVGIKDVRRAAQDAGDDVPVALTMAKIKKHWLKVCQELYDSAGCLDDEEVENIRMEDVALIVSLGEAMDSGNREIVEILQNHCLENFSEEEEEEYEEGDSELSNEAEEEEEVVAVGESDDEYEEYEDWDDPEAEAAAEADAESEDWE